MAPMIEEASFVTEVEIDEVLDEPAWSLRARVFASKVLVIRQARGSDLARFVALANKLGTPVEHVLAHFSLPDHREVIRISNLRRNGAPVGVHDGGTYWHTDMSYKDEAAVFTALHAHSVPRSSATGGTEFMDCQAAYEILKGAVERGTVDFLPDGFDLDAAMIRHQFGNRETLSNPRAAVQVLSPAQHAEVAGSARHPLILRHPVTGARSIYAVAATARIIEGYSPSESTRVLDRLLELVQAHAPRYTHWYRPGDIVVWDNLSTLHRGQQIASSDDEADCRMLHRMNLRYANGTASRAVASIDPSPGEPRP